MADGLENVTFTRAHIYVVGVKAAEGSQWCSFSLWGMHNSWKMDTKGL